MSDTEAAYKVCPTCAEHIQPEALVCKFCGYDYRVGSTPPTKTNGLAIASMVLGILWIYWIGSLLAVIFGHVAIYQINKSGGSQSGRGMAIAGLVLGYIGVGVVLLVLVFGLAFI